MLSQLAFRQRAMSTASAHSTRIELVIYPVYEHSQ